jgi:hypothetical protein
VQLEAEAVNGEVVVLDSTLDGQLLACSRRRNKTELTGMYAARCLSALIGHCTSGARAGLRVGRAAGAAVVGEQSADAGEH